jgi:hypothetical protein
MMDKFWIKKLGEVKARLRKHLADKARFEARSDRSSLSDLREGQMLKREEEQLRNHLAQLAEFGTGISAEQFDFHLDLKAPYQVTTGGECHFGPSALMDVSPFINFDVDKIFGKQAEEKPEPAEEKPPLKSDKIEKFTERVTQKYEAPIFNAIEERKFTSISPIKFHQKLESFTAKLAAADKYVNSILDKYIPKPAEISESPGFYIYQGQFVYLSRRGKWAKVRTTVLSQKDYFAEAETSMPVLARKRFAPGLEGELEISEAAELITDDLAEPVAAPNADLGLGYFVPVRRLGSTKQPAADIKHPAKSAAMPAGLPLVGSREFAFEVSQKAEDSGHPVEQISPAYVSVTGRKIDRARSFAETLKRKLQLPKSEPARMAVEALLPAMEEIVATADRQEEPVLELEKSFDDIVSRHLRPFKLAAESPGVSTAWMGSGETRVERILRPPQADALGVIGKYMPEITDPQESMRTLVSARTYPTEIFRKVEGVAPQAAPGLESPAAPISDFRAGERVLPREISRTPETAAGGLPGLFGRLQMLMPESLKRPARLLPGVLGSLTERMSGDRLGGLAGQVMGRLTGGLPGGIAERFGGLLPPSAVDLGVSGVTGLLGRIGRSPVSSLLTSATTSGGADRATDLFSGLSQAVTGLTGGAEPTGILGRVTGLLREGQGDLRPGRLGGMLDSPTESGGGISRLTSGGIGSMLSRAPSLLRSVTGQLPGGLTGAISRVLPGAQSAVSALTERGGGLIPGGISQAVSGLLPSMSSGLSSSEGGIAQRAMGGAGRMLGGLTGRLPGIGSMAERASGMASGLLGRAGLPSLGGIAERAGGLVQRLTGGGPSGEASGGFLSRGSSLVSRASQILPGAAGRAAQSVSGMPGGGMGAIGAIGAIGSAASSAMGQMGGIGGLATRAEGLSSAISGLTSRAGGALGGLGSRVSSATESMGAALPSMGSVRSMAEGAAESITSRMPSIGALPGLSSALSGVSQQAGMPQAPDMSNLPRGWDRPPFEVGSAIRRQIGERIPEQTGALPRGGRPALADYGLSVIDLEERATETVSETRQQIEEAAEIELDDNTIEEVYFRLKRILETESERMGGEE